MITAMDKTRQSYLSVQEFGQGTRMWSTPFYGINVCARVKCPDGKIRMARTHQQPCMFGAIDARVTMSNKQTVRGCITVTTVISADGAESIAEKVLTFHPHAWKIMWVGTVVGLFSLLPAVEIHTEWFSSEKAMRARKDQLWNPGGTPLTNTCHIFNPNGLEVECW